MTDNAVNTEKCKVCGQDATTSPSEKAYRSVTCQRCGDFGITKMLWLQLGETRIPNAHLLSGYIREQCETEGANPVILAPENYRSLGRPYPETIAQKADKLLEALHRRSSIFGSKIRLNPDVDYPLAYAQNNAELRALINYLRERKLVDSDSDAHGYTIVLRAERYEALDSPTSAPPTTLQSRMKSIEGIESMDGEAPKVFLVHGHNQELLQTVARFLERIDFDPVILFEQESRGQTIIEKLERHSSVPFAIVLMTADDLGKEATEDVYKRRARQNVVLELGYFIGKLDRSNVAVLYEEDVEMPSDYHAVEYIPIDDGEGWKLKLARELKAAGLSVDLNKL